MNLARRPPFFDYSPSGHLYVRTWAGAYVPAVMWPVVLLGWVRFLWRRWTT